MSRRNIQYAATAAIIVLLWVGSRDTTVSGRIVKITELSNSDQRALTLDGHEGTAYRCGPLAPPCADVQVGDHVSLIPWKVNGIVLTTDLKLE